MLDEKTSAGSRLFRYFRTKLEATLDPTHLYHCTNQRTFFASGVDSRNIHQCMREGLAVHASGFG